MDARLIVDAPATGSWNMAVDEALFLEMTAASPAVFRLYRWSQPTLSLGYFQPLADREQHAASVALPVVRRATGGGAIVHDAELTYCLAIPLRERQDVPQSFVAQVHESLASILVECGIQLRRVGAERDRGDRVEPFLCFERRSEQDLVLNDWKVVGSAQRRRRFALLQHGSILLRRSPAAPELPGIEDLAQVTKLAERLVDRWPTSLARALRLTLAPSELRPSEAKLAQDIVREKFAADNWNRKR